MSKELELFKKWFGITKEIKTSEALYPIEYITIDTDRKEVSYFKQDILAKECLDELYHTDLLCITNSMAGYIILTYKIPPQYHAEWEQYIK